ncbi:MFS general substrate transporter [Coprinopsis marcescibilis]|uniref:MFS general substrate transporter n=1 Tax=Coprinopsis marcescibilis TaxID=230819 RepID=A0A5C3L716_COPMA|nr:MFS general substrate transporter [Coprinopsis marcescibilis]
MIVLQPDSRACSISAPSTAEETVVSAASTPLKDRSAAASKEYIPQVLEKGSASVNTKEVDVERSEQVAVSFPEGGFRAWLVVFGVWITQFCSFGYTNAYGVYNDYYVRYYLANHTSAQISWIGSVQLCLVLSIGIVSGRAFDRGYFYHLMIGGSVLLVFCLFMLSITQQGQLYQVFLLQGVGVGIAIGLMYIPGVGIVSQYFSKRRSLALGLCTSGSALGGMFHPIILNRWFHGSLGFHNGVRASAGLNGGLLLIALLIMRTRPFPSKKHDLSAVKSFQVFLKDVPYAITVFGTLSVLAGLYYPIFFLQLNAIKNGISPDLAFYTLAILNGASAFGRVIPNLFVYRFGAFNIVIPCVFVAAILVFCTLKVDNAAGTMVFAILYGFFSGAYASLLPPMINSLSKSDSEIGSRLGVCFTFTGLGGLIGTPIAGVLLGSKFLWWRPIVFAGTCVTVGLICFVTTRIMKSKERGTQRL